MAQHREGKLIRQHAGSVVLHADKPLSPVFKLHVHARGPGVEAVLHKLLNHAGRTFHHLAGCYLIAELGRQDLNSGYRKGHGISSFFRLS